MCIVTVKKIRLVLVMILVAVYIALALCDVKDGRYRMGFVSFLFALVTWLVFF